MSSDHPRDSATGPSDPDAVELWALSRSRQALRWAGCLGVIAIIGYAVWTVLAGEDGGRGGSVGLGLLAAIALVRMLRVAVAVYLDPEAGTLTIFRTVGPALRTTTERVRRLDRGLVEQYAGAALTRGNRPRPPGVRIVTDDGVATLSVLFGGDVELDIAQALVDHHPDHLRVELD